MNDKNKPAAYKLEEAKDKKSVAQWFRDLFKGFWYGLSDMFLMSWGNILILLFMLFVPLTYAIVCSLGYWNPVNNIGKVEMPIFDADRSFIKVVDKEVDKESDGYKMGALAMVTDKDGNPEDGMTFINIKPFLDDKKTEPNPDYGKVLQNYTTEQLQEKIKNIKSGDTLVLNNGLIVTYNDQTEITPMDSWTSLKQSGILITKDKDKKDKDAKFEVAAAPNDELRFRNIKYISDKGDSNKDWRTGKYQIQVKLNNGYGAALLGAQGIAYDNSFDIAKADGLSLAFINANQKGLLPNTDIFQTFQRNFVSAYILSTVSNFASGIVDEMSPVLNAVRDNGAANETFGTKGLDIIEYLKQEKTPALIPYVKGIEANIDPNEYYLVLSKDDMDKSISQILKGQSLGITDTTNFDQKTLLGKDGKLSQWLEDVNYFANSKGMEVIKSDKSSTYKFIDKLSKDLTSSIKDLLTSPVLTPNVTNLIKDVYTNLGIQNAPADFNKFKLSPAFIDKENSAKAGGIVLHPFLPSKAIVDGKEQDINLFSLLSKVTMDNQKEYFSFLQPYVDMGMPATVNLLGSYYGAVQNIMKANGVDPSKLTNIETSRGASMGIFGIGLGQMFVFLGTFIGYTMLRAMIKRNKQYSKLTPRNWYLSKMLQYAVIGFIQTTITAWVIYAAGWNQYVSATAMTYEWLWLLMTTMVMMGIICGLQYAMDPNLGAVLSIFYLAFNITCSGASYPGWAESGFYHAISWVMPFTYFIEGSDQILYGVNNIGTTHYTTMRILQLWGYATCFFAFFFLIGLYGAGSSYKVSCYGSKHGNRVYDALESLERTQTMNEFRIPYVDKKGKTKFKYNWDVLVGPFDGELYNKTRNLRKKSKAFKWYRELRVKRKMEEQEDWLNR